MPTDSDAARELQQALGEVQREIAAATELLGALESLLARIEAALSRLADQGKPGERRRGQRVVFLRRR
jgi:hypothetical protein